MALARLNPADLSAIITPDLLTEYPELGDPALVAEMTSKYLSKAKQAKLARALPIIAKYVTTRIEPPALQQALDICRNARDLIKPDT